jgi:hypothetical protein
MKLFGSVISLVLAGALASCSVTRFEVAAAKDESQPTRSATDVADGWSRRYEDQPTIGSSSGGSRLDCADPRIKIKVEGRKVCTGPGFYAIVSLYTKSSNEPNSQGYFILFPKTAVEFGSWKDLVGTIFAVISQKVGFDQGAVSGSVPGTKFVASAPREGPQELAITVLDGVVEAGRNGQKKEARGDKAIGIAQELVVKDTEISVREVNSAKLLEMTGKIQELQKLHYFYGERWISSTSSAKMGTLSAEGSITIHTKKTGSARKNGAWDKLRPGMTLDEAKEFVPIPEGAVLLIRLLNQVAEEKGEEKLYVVVGDGETPDQQLTFRGLVLDVIK